MAIETPKPATEESIVQIAEQMENSRNEHLVCALIAQKMSDMAVLYVECCSADNVDKLVKKLEKKRGYILTAEPSGEFVVTEGAVINFKMSGNISFSEGESELMSKVFHPKVASAMIQPIIQVKDVSKAPNRGMYRGYLNVWPDNATHAERVQLPVALKKASHVFYFIS